jgi:hypothetical protein
MFCLFFTHFFQQIQHFVASNNAVVRFHARCSLHSCSNRSGVQPIGIAPEWKTAFSSKLIVTHIIVVAHVKLYRGDFGQAAQFI